MDDNPYASPAEKEAPADGAPPPKSTAPHPGVPEMPQWDTNELVDAPQFTVRNWFALLGPGLVLGGAAIGGGEWLLGPMVTARYGGAMLWLASLSILGQVIYNIEISRYTLYCGEPIFTGKVRLLPGPHFWVAAYLLFDIGAIFPYLAANAAAPIATLMKGGTIPDPVHVASDWYLMKALGYAIFLLALVPLLFGGKIYNSLKLVMSAKIMIVFGFLLLLAILFSSGSTWIEIFTGFFKIGTVPVQVPEGVELARGDNTANVFVELFSGRGLPQLDLKMLAAITGLAAIAGSGGLSNTPISNYTRDQGWGMGYHVGAIPSVVGGHNLSLSHVGSVFEVNETTLERFRRWYRHVCRDQLVVWLPACLIGVALPSMLSVQFLPYGYDKVDNFTGSVMTAGGVHNHVAEVTGSAAIAGFFWFMTVFCGFLVLAPSMSTSADGIIRRWVDVFWTSSARLRELDPSFIKTLYFRVLACYATFGLITLSFEPGKLVAYATMAFNIALGFSCWHTLAVNLILLPKELRPGWFVRISMVLSGLFFMVLGVVTVAKTLELF